jgi:tetratricopeptide (TPR) repeat protein/DNA-binding CsgD family transcriptional regulator
MDSSTLTVLTRGGEPELRRLFPALSHDGDVPQVGASAEPDEFRTRLMWNFAEFVKRYAGRGPILCVFEDLQWADESSLELLHFLARQVTESPVLVVCTYNDQDRDSRRALVRTERSLQHVGAGDVLELQPLQRAQVAELVSRSFSVDIDVVRDFAGVLYGWTRGNAFFVEEILKAMAASGRLRRESGTWVGWNAKEFGMPATIRDAILGRAEGFDDETRKVLDMAAVVGNRASFGVLESVSGLGADAVLTAVEVLCRVGLLEERSAGNEVVYDFRHPLVRQTLYDEFGLQRVKILHGVVAEAMESFYGPAADRHADELAYHFARTDGSRLRGKAARYLAAAGAQALERRADQEAIAYLRAALDRSEPEDAEMLRVVVPRLARALTHVGDFEGASALWRDVLDSIPTDDPRRAAVLRSLGMTNVWRGRHREAVAAFDEGLEAARDSSDAVATVRLLVAKAHGLHEVGQGTEALEVLSEALPIAEAVGDPALLARVHRALALLHVWLGPPEKAIEHGERAVELAEEVGDLAIGFWARWGLAVLAGMRGDTARMMRIVDEINAMAEEARSPVLRLWTADMVVEHAFGSGDWDTGIALGEQAIALARSLNQRTLLPRLLVWTSQVHLARGDVERADALVREAVDMAGIEKGGSLVDVHQVVPTYIGLAHYLLQLGDYEEAIEAAEKGLKIAEGTGYILWTLHRLLPVLGEACLWAGRFDRAAEVGARMRAHSERIDHRIGRSLADACDALVQWKRGDPAGAVAQMLVAADELEAIPMIWPATRLRRQVAGRLADLGRREEALAELRKVHTVCASVRAGLELEKTRAMFRELESRAPAGVPNQDSPLGLTEAELRVAVLVAQGMSNKAMAANLSCSPGTVRTHLQNIYLKLGIGGAGARHRLGNLAREAGLLESP